MIDPALLQAERIRFHASLLSGALNTNERGTPSNADGASKMSTSIAQSIMSQLFAETVTARLAGQTLGHQFEASCADFVRSTFPRLQHLRPGNWSIKQVTARNRLEIARYEQYEHLAALNNLTKNDPALAAALGSDYTITPDIVVSRQPEDDDFINSQEAIVDAETALHSGLRELNSSRPILHASISCKWTIRSDRSQNSRSEALNLIRNRKGRLPNIMVVTAEPLPSRIASIALGTGDIDCVYHFALHELQHAVRSLNLEDAADMLDVMVSGKRLKDITDLPMDLAI